MVYINLKAARNICALEDHVALQLNTRETCTFEQSRPSGGMGLKGPTGDSCVVGLSSELSISLFP